MKKNLMFVAAALMLLASCSPKKTTVEGLSAPNGLLNIHVTVSGKADTVVAVKGGRFEVEVPVDVTTVSRVKAGMSSFNFISDGSKLTVNLEDGTVVSSKKNGVHSRYVEYCKWMKDFQNAFYAEYDKMEKGSEEAENYFKTNREKYNDYIRGVIKDNKDNILGWIAVRDMGLDDEKEMLSLIKSLSSKIQALPEVVKEKQAIEKLVQ